MRLRFLLSVPVVALLAGAFISAARTVPLPQSPARRLAEMRLPDTTITAAETVNGGSFTPARIDQPDREPAARSVAWPA